MNRKLVPVFLPLLLLETITPVMPRLNSVMVISHRRVAKTKNGPAVCALDQANETTSSSSSLNDCSLKCGRDATCIGFNIKSSPTHSLTHSLTCDYFDTPVLASISRTRIPVLCTTTSRVLRNEKLPANFIRSLK